MWNRFSTYHWRHASQMTDNDVDCEIDFQLITGDMTDNDVECRIDFLYG